MAGRQKAGVCWDQRLERESGWEVGPGGYAENLDLYQEQQDLQFTKWRRFVIRFVQSTIN